MPFSHFWTYWNVSCQCARDFGLTHVEHQAPHAHPAADLFVDKV
jgi:hypothetical protein